MSTEPDPLHTTGHPSGSRSDGLAIRDGDRGIRLKWHKLRRHADDPPFHRPNLIAGLAAGAAMEVDIQILADGAFACLHDPTLETQTTGSGPVDQADSAMIRSLRQTDHSGVAVDAAPLLLEELVGIMCDRAADTANGASVQLDLKLSEDALSDPAVDRFARLVGPVARHLSLSGEDWPAVLRLGGEVAGLPLGFDPTPLLIDDPVAAADLSGFADRVMALAPRAETIYLHHLVFAAARDQAVDLTGAFHHAGLLVDCWTIGTNRAGTEEQLGLAVESGVDQITTDTPEDLQALWATMAERPG